MSTCMLVFLALGQTGQVESKDFTKEAQGAALRATVKVINHTKKIEGTAVIVKQKGKEVFFLTANHMVERNDNLEIQVFTAESYPVPAKEYKAATLVAGSKSKDVALLRLETTDVMPGVLPLCPPNKIPQAPDDKDFIALSVGCGRGDAPLCKLETVNRAVKVLRDGEVIKIKSWEVAAAQAKGRSGGPLIDKRGLVIGIASLANEDKGYYVHIDEIHQFLKDKQFSFLYTEERK